MRIAIKTIGVLVALALAESAALADSVQLPEILVKGQNLAPGESAFTTNVVEQDTIRERGVSRMQDLYRDIPGIAVQGYGLGGVADALNMRGFSSGGHGGDVGLVIDGIALNEAMSHADGYADQNVIIPLEVERMTVYKGPSSALYGNYSRAGTIALESRKSGDYREFDVKAGSYGTLDAQAAAGARLGPTQINIAAQHYTTDGFRDQSHTWRSTASGRLGFDLGGGAILAVSGRVHEGRWDSAGYITGAQNADRGARFDKDPRMQNDSGGKRFATGRIDLSKPLEDGTRLLMYAYGTQQTFYRYFTRPTSPALWEQRLEDYDRGVGGLGMSLNGGRNLAGKDIEWVLGAEALRESTKYTFKDGLDNRAETAITTGGTKPYLNREYANDSLAAFGQAEWKLAPWLRPALGMRVERLSGDCSVRGMELDAGSGNPCQAMATYTHASPKIGVRSTWSPRIDTRFSYSEGFQLPPAEARFGGGGGSVQPSTVRQLDAGMTLRPAHGMLLDVSLFRIETRNETRDLGSGIFENFGKTRRDGLEIEGLYSPIASLDLSAALTLLHTTTLQSADPAAIGKALPTVPERTATLRGRYRYSERWFADLTVQCAAGYSVASDGSASNGGHTTADLTVGWEPQVQLKRMRLYVSVYNLANRAYSTTSLVSSGTQLYAPAAPRTVMAGISMDI